MIKKILIFCVLIFFISHAPSNAQNIPTIKEDITLEKSVNIALKYNPMLNKMKEDYLFMQNMKNEVKSELYPKLYFSVATGYNNMPNILSNPYSSIIMPEKGGINIGLNIMYPLYTGGKINSSVKSAEYKEYAINNEIYNVENDIAFLTKKFYFSVLLAIETVKIYTELVNLQEKQVMRAKEIYTQGKIALVYLLRAQNECAKNKQMLNMAIADKESTIAEFKEIIGINQESELNFNKNMTAYEFDKTLQECLTFVNQRPDILAAQNIIESAKEDINIAKSEYLPQIYVMGMSDYMNKFKSGEVDYNYGIALNTNIPVFDAGSRDSKTKSAENILTKYTQERDSKILNAQKEIVSAWWNYSMANRNINLSDTAVNEAEEIHRIINLKYETGKVIYLELLDATVNLSMAKLNKYKAIYQNNVAYADLYKAIGLK